MKEIYLKSIRKIMGNSKELESKLKVKISVKGDKTLISGKEVDEYFAERVLIALDFPFTIDEALLLLSETYMFSIVNIKDHTRRHDFNVIKGRIIGTKGKTLKVLKELSNSVIVVKDNDIAIISPVEEMENATQAVVSLIRGSKQGNVYTYLERGHKSKKKER
ncbi:MAG TPA: hypothetical protein VI815_01815 [Candidatus Nanoarchaeia archaeon]|nr:hypothetical protein [Candidatus Nanoarchaeia archaeon]